MACGDFKHPLLRGGASAADRNLPGLQAGYVQVDEKDVADWIVYADQLSANVRFYNESNTAPSGSNWKPFFSKDISATMAFVAVQDPEGLGGITTRLNLLRDDANQSNAGLPILTKTLAEVFGAALTFAKSLDDLLERLLQGSSVTVVTTRLIETRLASTIARLLAYLKAADAAGLISAGSVPDWKILGRSVEEPQSITLDDRWITNSAADWAAYLANIVADPSIFGSGPNWSRIRHAANHNLFSSLFDQLFSAYARILKEGAASLRETLEAWEQHPPHYALFLAFLKLLKLIQSELNKFTTRHLDFYYRDVLQLLPKAPAPDSAYVTIELAKQTPNYLLPEGTLFRGGKDSLGHDVFYALQKDVGFNKARVGKLMSVYRGAQKDNIGSVTNLNRWFAAPAINSADGNGAKLISNQREWHPYVNRTYVDGELQSIDEPLAQIGFAIASHYLALAEGRRVITVRLATSNNSALQSPQFEVFFTTIKGWLQATVVEKSTGTMTDGSACAVFAMELDPTAGPVTDYDPKIHGGTLAVSVPVVKLVLKNLSTLPYEYEALRDITVTKLEIQVDVGVAVGFSAEGVKQLMLASSAGTVDPAKSFLPFGPHPEPGASFIIGSKEIFSKKGANIRFNAEWVNLPDDDAIITFQTEFPETMVEVLIGGVWVNPIDEDTPTEVTLFDETNGAVAFADSPLAVPDAAIVAYSAPFDAYSNQSRAGFVRLRLEEGFGYKEYLSTLTQYLIELSKSPDGTTTTPKPVEPYNPTLQSFTVSYAANSLVNLTTTNEASFSERSSRFFHLYPFGDGEQHVLIADAPVYLMPQFRYIETPGDSGSSGGTSIELINQAEFYFGLEAVEAGESVSILFQFLEGTSDPQVLKPDEHLYFSYLSNNAWKAIRRDLVADSTRQFIQSGLIELAIPPDATTTNSVLPSGFIWLRFSVAEAPDAIAKIVDIVPQSALVTYHPGASNAPDFPHQPLPAGTISKLKEPNSAIKKIQQRYPSFRVGGSGETDALFNTRVGERLRHKDRAITIWDYERLVLQAFSGIHKVKCISHTTLVPDPDNPAELICNEMAPGHVLVITIPDLTNRNDANPLRPYTNADLLAEIQEFLRNRVTCHADVLVANPLVEEVRMEFNVTLRKGYSDAAFYRQLLQNELAEFLTPWAFAQGADIQFGGKIFKSSLIDFIEERAYVDFLTDVQLFHKAGDTALESEDFDEVTASTARSILVSAPASKHAITVLLHEESVVFENECCADE